MRNNILIETLPKVITEQDVSELFMSPIFNSTIAWFKDTNGYYLNLTTAMLNLLTIKNFSSVEYVIGQHEYDLHKKIYREKADLYIKGDEATHQEGYWQGVEPCHFRHQFKLVLTYKKAIYDNHHKIVGALGCVLQFVDIEKLKDAIRYYELTRPAFELGKGASVEILPVNPTIELKQREKECLYYTLHGKSAKAIASILQISSKTVEYYLEQIKNKFNVISKSQLIEKGISMGYLDKLPEFFITKQM